MQTEVEVSGHLLGHERAVDVAALLGVHFALDLGDCAGIARSAYLVRQHVAERQAVCADSSLVHIVYHVKLVLACTGQSRGKGQRRLLPRRARQMRLSAKQATGRRPSIHDKHSLHHFRKKRIQMQVLRVLAQSGAMLLACMTT